MAAWVELVLGEVVVGEAVKVLGGVCCLEVVSEGAGSVGGGLVAVGDVPVAERAVRYIHWCCWSNLLRGSRGHWGPHVWF